MFCSDDDAAAAAADDDNDVPCCTVSTIMQLCTYTSSSTYK